jgi:hypothetical protein
MKNLEGENKINNGELKKDWGNPKISQTIF